MGHDDRLERKPVSTGTESLREARVANIITLHICNSDNPREIEGVVRPRRCMTEGAMQTILNTI